MQLVYKVSLHLIRYIRLRFDPQSLTINCCVCVCGDMKTF